MGADMTVAWLPYCQITEERKRRLRLAVSDLNEEEIATIKENICHETDCQAYLLDLIEQLQDTLHGRDVTTIRPNRLPYWLAIAGGLSWGDAPSEAYTLFGDLGYVNKALDLLQEWATEEYAAAQVPVLKP